MQNIILLIDRPAPRLVSRPFRLSPLPIEAGQSGQNIIKYPHPLHNISHQPRQLAPIFRPYKLNTRYNSSYILIQCVREASFMNINTDMIVSITEANQNFSRIAKLVDEKGSAVIFKNNRPRYLLIDFGQAQEMAEASDEDVLSISKRLISKNRVAYDELAK